MHVYYCWVTALIPDYQDGIVAGMAKKGYMIGPLSKDGVVLSPGQSSSGLIALNVYHRENVDVEIDKVYKDLSDVLDDMKARYFSIIVAQSTGCRWYGSNFDIVPVAEEIVPPKKTMN